MWTWTVKDLRSGMIGCYPMPDKSADRVMSALVNFRGARRIELLYGDILREIEAVAEPMRLLTVGDKPAKRSAFERHCGA